MTTPRPGRTAWKAPEPSDGNPIARVVGAGTEVVHAGRRRAPWFDHLVHAGGHYNRSQSDMLAAGVTYYVFLALFPVVLLAASIAGFVLSGDQLLQDQLTSAVRDAVPGRTGALLATQVSDAIDNSGIVGTIGLIGFLFIGMAAMDKIRTGMEFIWRGAPDQADFVFDRVKDLGALLRFAAVGALSIGLTVSTTAASSIVFEVLGIAGGRWVPALTVALGFALALVSDTLVFLWLLKHVPRTPFRYRELLPGALFGAVGFELLKLVGNFYLSIIGGNVTAQTFGSIVGIIVWINVVARFAFFTACWTATIPAIEDARLPVPLEAQGPTPLPDVALVDERAARPAPLRLAAGLLGAGALVGVASWGLLLRLTHRRWDRPDRPDRPDLDGGPGDA